MEQGAGTKRKESNTGSSTRSVSLLGGAITTALILAVTACGTGETTTVTSAPDPIPSWDDFDSPLEDALDMPSDPEERMAVRVRYEQDRTDFIADCMRRRGFEYPQLDVTAEEVAGPGWDLPEQDFVDRFGFGVIAGLRYQPDSTTAEVESHVNALPPQERNAFRRALEGLAADPSARPDGSGQPPQAKPTHEPGCRQLALDEIALPWERPGSRAAQALTMVENRKQGSSALQQLYGEWSACMARRGYPGLENPQSGPLEIGNRLAMLPAANPTDGRVGAALEALQEEELAMAKASLDCERDTRVREMDIIADIEREIVEELGL